MKISYLMLAHEPFELLCPLIKCLLEQGSNVYFHYDLKARDAAERFHSLNSLGLTGSIHIANRCLVKWGEWSIAQATLNCINKIDFHADDSDYFMLLSGSCFPIKPLSLFAEFLDLNRLDYIECVNANKQRWVTGGIQNDRWTRYHFFNYRFQRIRFETSLNLQRKLKIKRKLPQGLTPYIGSQWWCLRRKSLQNIVQFIDSNPAVEKFYATTCIPDESFFQTLVGNLVPQHEISRHQLTEYNFNSWGVPRNYYDDDFRELVLSHQYFARKVSSSAHKLRERLVALYAASPQTYNQMIASECIDANGENRRLSIRSFYEMAKCSRELWLASAHPCSEITSRIVLYACPSALISRAFENWLLTSDRFALLDRANRSKRKYLMEALRDLSSSDSGKSIAISCQEITSEELSSLVHAQPIASLVILPPDFKHIKTPHMANLLYTQFTSGLRQNMGSSFDGAIDLFRPAIRSHQYGRKSYFPSSPLFSRLLSIGDLLPGTSNNRDSLVIERH